MRLPSTRPVESFTFSAAVDSAINLITNVAQARTAQAQRRTKLDFLLCSASQQVVMKQTALSAPSPIRRFPCVCWCIYNGCMPISARNKLRGTIEEIKLGDIMAHVVVRVGDNMIESAITRRSADELKLKKGDTSLLSSKLPK
jgi:molybdopterin-binding protein